MELKEYANYRTFIRDHLAQRAPRGRGEIAKLAEFMRVHPTFVSQVLAGVKDFNMEQSFAVANFLELTKVERKYFLLLVQRDRAGTKDLKDYFKTELAEIKTTLLMVSKRLKDHRSLSDEDRAIFYSSWLYAGVRLYCSIEPGKNLEEVCIYFGIGRKKALGILEFLASKDLVLEEKGRFKLGTLHTHLPSDSPFIIRHHMNWRTKALQGHEGLSSEELAFTAPMSIAKKDFEKIREKIMTCIKDSIDVAKESEAEDLAFLNIDWMWVKPRESI